MSWSPSHVDGLTEILNIGIGKAAAVLYEMVGQEILFSVPAVEFVNSGDLERMLEVELSDKAVGIRQSFSGDFNGTAILFFLEKSSVQLVNILLGDELSGEQAQELEAEAMSELGNILLNGCLGAVANTFGRSLEIHLPEFVKGDPNRMLPSDEEPDTSIVVRVRLSSEPSGIGGLIVLCMNDREQERLHVLLDEFLAAACA
ncbi:MAG: hypothetical protein KDF64_02655 [Geminicoccaceae bacterium]|nr:hypothetical protein [Geminicoccaceae bacterium]